MRKKKNEPVLVIMAAGMGSRYGGLKQMDPLGPGGEVIIDYSLYDARRAGFKKVICIIKHEIEEGFKEIMDRGAAKYLDIDYAFQDINDIPEGFTVPEDRKKPWGTGHAILAARDLIDSPFAVINADDYYGPEAFKLVYDYLSKAEDKEAYDYCMVGYRVENTITENGTVARGICVADEGGCLRKIDERLNVGRGEDGKIRWTDGEASEIIPEGTLVSMNFFGFTPSIIKELKARFPKTLEKILAENPVKGEFYIPIVTSDLVSEGKATVRVLDSSDRWYGVTYREDRPKVTQAMREKVARGEYPARLWE